MSPAPSIEGDLAESSTHQNETTYVFRLRQGVKWHNKPPRERPRADRRGRRFSFDHFLTSRATPTPTCSTRSTRWRRSDKYTVKFTLKEPFAWFLDMLANPMPSHRRQGSRGEVRRPQEAGSGHRHRALDAGSSRPNVGLDLRAQPEYFVRACPISTGSRPPLHDDNAPRMAAFLSGKYRHRVGISRARCSADRCVKDRRQAEAAADHSSVELPVARHDSHLDAHRSRRRSTTYGSATPCRWLSTARPSSTRPWRRLGVDEPAGPAGSWSGRSRSTSSARAPSTTSTTQPRPSGS